LGPGREDCLQDAPAHSPASVALDFDHVFAGVTVGRPKDEYDRLVDNPVRRIRHVNLSVEQGLRRTMRRWRAPSAHHPVGNGECPRPGQADHGNPPGSPRCGYGGDSCVCTHGLVRQGSLRGYPIMDYRSVRNKLLDIEGEVIEAVVSQCKIK
jgi:hypothetical protein